MKLYDLIELLMKIKNESDNETIVYVSNDNSEDGDLELIPFVINEGFKSEHGNYVILR